MATDELIHDATPHYIELAKQVMHNLQYAHRWTEVRMELSSATSGQDYLRPIVTGVPPNRLYIHPDEQAAILAEQRQQKKGSQAKVDLPPSLVREWVLPTHIREKTSLHLFAQVFDIIGLPVPVSVPAGDNNSIPTAEEDTPEWAKIKRLILATLTDDSTIVYYIMHDGLVKPRQN